MHCNIFCNFFISTFNYYDNTNLELADLLEVVRAVATARGSSIEEVEAIRRDKAAKRGGFEKKILLTEVTTGD